MVSKPCDNCNTVKKCKMHYTVEETPGSVGRIEYLCNKCAKELGYDKRD